MRKILTLVVTIGLSPVSAAANESYDLIFRGGTLDAFGVGERISYTSDLTLVGPTQKETRETLTLSLASDGKVVLHRHDAGRTGYLAEFGSSAGNPMAMYFLENVVREVASATGGSPFYIRNRMKESLLAPKSISDIEIRWDGAVRDAMAITLAPFANDKNRVKFGGFADLEIVVTVSEAVPGWYHHLRAETPEAPEGSRLFVSEIILTGVEE